MIFQLRAHHFEFRAIDSVYFPPGKAGNVLRGALLENLGLDNIVARSRVPGGFAEPPRPFVLRAAHLNGRCFAPGETFGFALHVFDLRSAFVRELVSVLRAWACTGIGPRRGRVTLLNSDLEGTQVAVSLVEEFPASKCSVVFRTPTTLKGTPSSTDIPFAVLFGRAGDRIAALRELYGDGPLAFDFRAASHRAALVRTVRSDLRHHKIERRSSRTGAVHGIGGVTGPVDYEGDLGEFLPWLRAACWTGVGRHTVWGNGVFELVLPK